MSGLTLANSLIVIGGTIANLIVFFISFPFGAILVKYRVNYTPKRIQESGAGDHQSRTGSVTNSYSAIIQGVMRLEGWTGMYKGFMPSFIFLVVEALIDLLHIEYEGGLSAPVGSVWRRLAYRFVKMVIYLPARVMINRAITTPYRLPWFNGTYSLCILLTETERRRPWLLFLTPGLLVSETLSITYTVLVTDPLHMILLDFPQRLSPARLGAHLGLCLVSTVIICPLAVVSARLFIQRNHPSSSYASIEKNTNVKYAIHPTISKDAAGIFNQGDPYVGFVDCVKRIVKDEGCPALFRAWWYDFVLLICLLK